MGRFLQGALLLLLLTAATTAQNISDMASMPSGLSRGTPAGSYALSEMENISIDSGNLNVAVPLLKIGGRGGAGYTMMLPINKTPWWVETTMYGFSCGIEDGSDNICWKWNPPALKSRWWTPVEPKYDPGVVQGHYVSVEPDTCSGGSPAYYKDVLTTINYTAPDGTDHTLYDEETGGVTRQRTDCSDLWNNPRGRVFSAKDGSGITFVADEPVQDDINPDGYPREGLFWPAGYLKMSDGSVYRVVWGRVEWIRDRNGNVVTFKYDNYSAPDGIGSYAYRRVIKITDSLGRDVNISYDVQDAQYGLHDRIEYKGFGGASRVIRVAKTAMANVLRPTEIYNPSSGIFAPLSGSGVPNPTVVSSVWLPDGLRRYKFFYNEYTELARLELPTGAAVDYHYWASKPPGTYQEGMGGTVTAYASGLVAGPYSPHGRPYAMISRRLRDRVLLADGTTPELKTTYSRPTQIGHLPRQHVTVDQLDAGDNNRLLSRQKHYYYTGDTETEDGVMRTSDRMLWDWKEYRLEDLSTDNNDTILRRVDTEWEQGIYETQRDGRPWSPYIKEAMTSVREANGLYRVSRSSVVDPADPTGQTVGIDQYGNKTDTWEYDYGTPAALGTAVAGPLLRRSHTDFKTEAAYTDAVSGAHMRHLPWQSWISADATGARKQSLTTLEYDNYSGGNGSAPLAPRGDISWLCLRLNADNVTCDVPSTAGYATRGNPTSTTQHLLDNSGTQLGSVTSYQHYDVAGNIVASVDPAGAVTQLDYTDKFGTPNGEAQSNSSPGGLAGLKGYAFPTMATNALGHVTYTQYDYQSGRVVNTEDANGTVSAMWYDEPLDRLRRVEQASNVTTLPSPRRQTTYDYDDDTRTVTTTSDLNVLDDNLLKSVSVYDGLSRVTEARRYEAAGQYTTVLTEYDAFGRIAAVSNPFHPASDETRHWTTTAYDTLGRISVVTAPDGAKTYTLYDGARTLITDPARKQRITQTNALGRLMNVWEVVAQDSTDASAESLTFPVPEGIDVPAISKGYKTSYAYDVLGNLCKVEHGVQRRYFAYDSLSRLIRVRHPEQTPSAGVLTSLRLPTGLLDPLSNNNNDWSLAYEYNSDGSLKKWTDARGVSADYTYDALGRVKKRTYSGEPGVATPEVTYTYDSPDVPFSKGRLTSVSSSVSTYSYTAYDEAGRVKGSKQKTGDATYLMPDYKYNLAGSLISEQYPSGRVVNTEHDEVGRIGGVRDGATNFYYVGASSSPADANQRLQYAPHGAVSSMKFGNGLWEHTSFNSRLQPELLGLGSSPTDAGKLRITYGYAAAGWNNGNVTSQRIEADGLDVTQTYIYDALNRLASAEEKSGATSNWKQVFSYDRYGNRNFAQGTTSPNYSLTPNNEETGLPIDPVRNPVLDTTNNRIKQTTTGQSDYRYDGAGNLLCEPGRLCVQGQTSLVPFYDYDAENRLKSAGGGYDAGGTSYSYDGAGQRVKKRRYNGETTVFVYDALGRVVAEYSNQAPAGGTLYLTQDNLGSTRAVTDSQGVVKGRHDYLPYGEEVEPGVGGRTDERGYVNDNVRPKFTSKERDVETGLDFFGARYYESSHGRFVNPDPLLTSGRVANPQTWNRYAYALGNPLRFIDPDGLFEWDATLSDDTSLTSDERKRRGKLREAILNGLDQARVKADKALQDGKLTQERYNAIIRGLNAYGAKPGEAGSNNGVTVGIGTSKPGAAGEVTSDFLVKMNSEGTAGTLQTSISVKFDEGFLKSKVAYLGVVHEGVHVADAQAFGNGWKGWGDPNKALDLFQYDTEVNAFTAQSHLMEAVGQDGDSIGMPVWQNSWRKMEAQAREDTRKQAINAYIKSAYGLEDGPGAADKGGRFGWNVRTK